MKLITRPKGQGGETAWVRPEECCRHLSWTTGAPDSSATFQVVAARESLGHSHLKSLSSYYSAARI
jgi:hypothetical protein